MPNKQLTLTLACSVQEEAEQITLVLAGGLPSESDSVTRFRLKQTARTLARALVYGVDLRIFNDLIKELDWAFDDYVAEMEPTWEGFVLER